MMYNILISSLLLLTVLSEDRPSPIRPTACADHFECKKYKMDSQDAAKCFGYAGCFRAKINMDSNVLCSGHYGCRGATIETGDCGGTRSCKESVQCVGFKSCLRAKSITTNVENGNVACSGPKSCMRIRPVDRPAIVSAGSITCDGSQSCMKIKVMSAKTTFCDGLGSCFGTTINSASQVECDGPSACRRAKIHAYSGNIHCYGKFVCKQAKIDADAVNAYGFFGAIEAKIFTSTLRAQGFNALVDATVEPSTNSAHAGVLDVTASGYRALTGTVIRCRSGQDCILKCKANACKKAFFSCELGAICDVKPKDCVTGDPNDPNDTDFVKKVKGDFCPKWLKQQQTEEADANIAAFRQSMQTDEDYLEVMQELKDEMELDEEQMQSELEYDDLMNEQEDDLLDMIMDDYDEEIDDMEFIGDDFLNFEDDQQSQSQSLLFGGKMNKINSVSIASDTAIYSHLLTSVIASTAAFMMVFSYYKIKRKDIV